MSTSSLAQGSWTETFGLSNAEHNFKRQASSAETCELDLAATKSVTTGKIKWFDPRKGYGFIEPDTGGADVFLHISSAEAGGLSVIFQGQQVNYELVSKEGRSSARVASPLEVQYVAEPKLLVSDDPPSPTAIEAINRCTSQLVYHLKRYPEDVYRIHPGVFEELVARIYENDGFAVEFQKGWNQPDGGVDIIVMRKEGIMPVRTVIQCKRYSRENRVTAEPIRSLAGVLDRFRAHAGVLATTSYFTKPAVEETRNHFWRVGLSDFNDIVDGIMRLS